MNNLYDDIETLLWPRGYTTQAMDRGDKAGGHLKSLYRAIMPRNLFANDDFKLDLNFQSTCDLSKFQSFLYTQETALPLTVVTTTRNDNHVERMEERTQAFIDTLALLAARHQRPVELIIVEWNPPKEAAGMAEAFSYPKNHPYLSIRIVTIEDHIHARYDWSHSLPLYQMIAKNVGIRRARGKFVLATNIDVILSDELFLEITKDDLEAGKIYRSNRWDVDRKILDLSSPEEMLGAARDLCFQINYASGLWEHGTEKPEQIQSQSNFLGLLPDLHTMACGDFQMLHRDDWAKVGGYSELDAYSFHIDSLFALTCSFAKFEEVRLDDRYPHYHIDHTLGTAVKSDTYVINEEKSIKHLSMGSLLTLNNIMCQQDDTVMFNHDHWGLANDLLPGHHVTLAGWEAGPANAESFDGDQSQASAVSLKELSVDLTDLTRSWLEMVTEDICNYLDVHASGKNYILWGAGYRSAVFADFLEKQGKTVSGYIHGTDTPPHPLIDKTLMVKPDNIEWNGQSFVLIASIYADTILDQISKQGAVEGSDYIVLP